LTLGWVVVAEVGKLRGNRSQEERMTAPTPPPQDPYSYPGGHPGGQPGRQGAQIFSILAIICGVISVLILPIIFGPIGIILGFVARSRREPLWKVGIGVAAAGMILGFILAAVVLSGD